MSVDRNLINNDMYKLFPEYSEEELSIRLSPKAITGKKKIPRNPFIKEKTVLARWDTLQSDPSCQSELFDDKTREQMECYKRNIENFIGTVKLPVGLAGPLRVNGLHAQDDYYIPLATSEAALVASYNRGAQLITQCGGAASMVVNCGVTRAPGFLFNNLIEAGKFVEWSSSHFEKFRLVAATTTRYGNLKDMRVSIEGNHVYLHFKYETGDASGQNMVTIATEAIMQYILEQSPIKPQDQFIDGNISGDKKASAISFLGVRGKKVTAEVNIPAALISSVLHTTAERMAAFWQLSTIGGVLSGITGIQGHYANGLAALYIATGQDAACVAESAVGVTRFELNKEGGLYASVTMPNLIVGTVGGGTGLPSQKACLDIMKLAGANNAMAFAEVCAVLCLAGEISITGAFCAGHFSRAHKQLARG